MTFADEIEKVASERFSLVRLEPSRRIDQIWTDVGGGLFTYDIGYIVSKITEDGSDMTEVSGTPSDGEWSQDSATKTITVNPTSGSPTAVVAFFYLFYSSEYGKEYPTSVTTGDTVLWENRIIRPPDLSQNITNLTTSAILSSSQSSLVLADTDSEFSDIITDETTIKEKELTTWLIVNGEIQKTFKGIMKSLRGDDRSVTISVNDFVSTLLNNTAYIGELKDAIASRTNFTDLRKDHEGRPIHFVYGNYSPYALTSNQQLKSGSDETFNTFLRADRNTLRGVDIGNNEWILCRIPAGASLKTRTLLDRGVGITIEDNYEREDTTEIGRRVTSEDTAPVASGFLPGEAWSYTASGTKYAICSGVDEDSDQVDFITDRPSSVGSSSNPRTYQALPWIVVRKGGRTYMPYPTLHYTTSLVATSDGTSQFVKITFTSQFFTDIQDEDASVIMPFEELDNPPRNPGGGDFARVINGRIEDMADTEVYFRVLLDETSIDINHADVLQDIIEDAGLTVNSTSFAAAKSALAADTQFTIPFLGQSNYGTYKDYIEAICRSSLGVVYLNNSDEIVYDLLAAPGTSSKTFTENEILTTGASYDVRYQDIVTEIQFSNRHVVQQLLISEDSEVTITQPEAQYLHGFIRKRNIEHVFADITVSSRHEKILDLFSNRFVLYRIPTAALGLDIDINDTITLENDILTGTDASKTLRVLGFNKKEDTVMIMASDLLGL